jgi:hypothetical protein
MSTTILQEGTTVPFIVGKVFYSCVITSGPTTIKDAKDIEWDTYNGNSVVEKIRFMLAEKNYGEIIGISIGYRILSGKRQRGNENTCCCISVKEKLSPNELKQKKRETIPAFLDVPLPESLGGGLVRFATDVRVGKLGTYFHAMPQGSDVQTDDPFCTNAGILTHVPNKGVMRGISAAHVLTNHLPAIIGTRIALNLPNGDKNAEHEYTVAGELGVTHYAIDEQVPVAERVYNKFDFAWSNPIVGATSTISSVGDLVDATRPAKRGERILTYSHYTGLIHGEIIEVNVEHVFDAGHNRKVYNTSGFVVSLEHEIYAKPGLSGALVFPENRESPEVLVLGMVKGGNLFGFEQQDVYTCPHPAPNQWGNTHDV